MDEGAADVRSAANLRSAATSSDQGIAEPKEQAHKHDQDLFGKQARVINECNLKRCAFVWPHGGPEETDSLVGKDCTRMAEGTSPHCAVHSRLADRAARLFGYAAPAGRASDFIAQACLASLQEGGLEVGSSTVMELSEMAAACPSPQEFAMDD